MAHHYLAAIHQHYGQRNRMSRSEHRAPTTRGYQTLRRTVMLTPGLVAQQPGGLSPQVALTPLNARANDYRLSFRGVCRPLLSLNSPIGATFR
jgi:hypothetical protein